MKITASQLGQLDRVAEASFVARLEDYLRKDHAAAVAGLSDEELRARMLAAVARAREHGFTWESAIAGFVGLMFELGPRFDRHPAFARALAIALPDQNARLRALYDNTTDEDWDEVVGRRDRNAWALADAKEPPR